MLALGKGHFQQPLFHRNGAKPGGGIDVYIGVEHYFFLDHLGGDDIAAVYLDHLVKARGLGRGGDAQLDFGTDIVKHLRGLVGGLGPKEVFFVDDGDDGQPLVAGAPHDFVEADTALAVAYYAAVVSDDTLPVDE